MSGQVEIKIDNDTLSICGDLDFDNVMSAYQNSLKFFTSSHVNLIMDFSGLHTTNSAALAIIINWMNLARNNHKTIQFKHLSADIMSLAKASGLDKVIEPAVV